MQQNPYESPSEEVVGSEATTGGSTNWSRPFGISMIGPLIVLFGFQRLLSALWVLQFFWNQGTGALTPVSMSMSLGLPTGLGVAYLVTGGGLWNGRRWSWWLTCIGLTVYIGLHLGSIFESSDASPQELMRRGSFAMRSLFAILGVGYLLTGRVLSFFGLHALKPAGRRIPLVMSCLMIIAGVAAIAYE